MSVSVLFARRDSIYKSIYGVEVWDEDRDARKWPGGAPVVAHPPCRLWGRLHTFAKSRDVESEKELGLFAVDMVRKHGGVLEHPACSKLWKAKGMPVPGAGRDEFGGYTLEVSQSDWGHRAQKLTWLYVVGVDEDDLPDMPEQKMLAFGLVELMATPEREKTPKPFALWLVELAKRARK